MDRIGASLRAFAVPLFLPTFGSQSESVLTDVNLWWSACSGQQRLSSLTLVAMQMKRSKFAPNYIRYSFRMPPALVFRTSAVSIRNTNSSNFSVFPSCASIQQLLTLDTEGFPSQSWRMII
jgi:hypothetical protein